MIKDRIIGYILALNPIFCIYAAPFLMSSLGLFVMYLIAAPLLLISLSPNITKDKFVQSYFVFTLYSILVTIVFRGFGGHDFISYIINAFVLMMILHEKKYIPYFLKAYIFLSAVFSIFLIVQAVAFYVLGIQIDGILPIPTVYEESTSMRAYDYLDVARISSVFMEPSHFALYVVPALVILLWDIGIKVKRKKICVILYVGATLMSTSGNGIVLLAIVGFLYFLSKIKSRKNLITTITVSLVLICAGLYIASQSTVINYTIESFSAVNTTSDTKTYYRVDRGFKLYADLPIYAKVIGVGYRNAENACKEISPQIVSKYKIGDVVFDYFNSVAGILIYFGLIGFALISYFFLIVWRRSSSFGGKAIIIIIVATCVSSSIFDTDTWFLYVVLLSVIIHTHHCPLVVSGVRNTTLESSDY